MIVEPLPHGLLAISNNAHLPLPYTIQYSYTIYGHLYGCTRIIMGHPMLGHAIVLSSCSHSPHMALHREQKIHEKKIIEHSKLMISIHFSSSIILLHYRACFRAQNHFSFSFFILLIVDAHSARFFYETIFLTANPTTWCIVVPFACHSCFS